MGMEVGEEMRSFLLTRRLGRNKEDGAYSLRGWREILSALFALSTVLMVASACSEKVATLEERIQAYWEARVKGKVEQAFTFEKPGSIEQLAYLKKLSTSPVTFTASAIRSVREKDDEAEVELQVQYLLPGLSRSVSSSMLDKWVKIKGQWYHLLPLAGDDGTSSEERG
jgi:hypothetical protein